MNSQRNYPRLDLKAGGKSEYLQGLWQQGPDPTAEYLFLGGYLSALQQQSSFLDPQSNFLDPQSNFLDPQSNFLEIPYPQELWPSSSIINQQHFPQQHFSQLCTPLVQPVFQRSPSNSCVAPTALTLNPSHNVCHQTTMRVPPTSCPASPCVLSPEAPISNDSNMLRVRNKNKNKTTRVTKPKGPRKNKLLSSFLCDHPDCGWVFDRRYNLDSHKKTHEKVKPNTCTMTDCGKSFLRKADLARHMRKHTKDTPFQCEFCNERFGRTEPRLRHYHKDHSNEYRARMQQTSQ